MSLHPPEPLQASHAVVDFDCGRPALNEWLQRHALQANASGSARSFVVCDGQQVVGYYSLTVGQVSVLEVPDRVAKGLGRYPVPVVILARLAVAQAYQGRGMGPGLLQDAIRRTCLVAEQAGVRALLTHPLDEAAAHFYLRFGFMPSPIKPGQLLLLLKDARRYLVPAPG